MKNKRILSLLLAFLLIATMVAGCSPKPQETNTQGTETQNQPEANADTPTEPQLKQISIGGAGTSGTFYIMAAGFTDIITKEKIGRASCRERV